MSKSQWKRESGYIWAMLGSAVGFANILSFSAQCYRNGGGAFLIPYIVAMLTMGVPLLFLEGLVGKKLGLPIVSAFGKVMGATGKTFGWLSVIAVMTIGAFYTVLTGYSVAYTYFAAAGEIPFETAHFFKNTFLQDSGSLSQFGGISVSVLIATLAVIAFSWWVMVKKVQSGIEKICAVFLPLLGVIVIFFAVSIAFFPGASQGFYYYLKPDFSKLGEFSLWRDVFGQLFFSLSLGLGIVTGYSRHTGETTSIRRAMLFVAAGDFAISFIAGFAVFGCVGYLSYTTGVSFNEIVKSDSAFEMGFVVFPSILHSFGETTSRIIGPLFFFCLFIAGVTGVFSIVESAVGNVEVEFKKTRKAAVAIVMSIMTVTMLVFCMGNGSHILGALQPMVIGYNMLIGGIAEIIVFMYFAKWILSDPIWFNKNKRTFAYYSLKYIVVVILGAILIAAVLEEMNGAFGLAESVRWGWFGGALALSICLAQKKNKTNRSSCSRPF